MRLEVMTFYYGARIMIDPLSFAGNGVNFLFIGEPEREIPDFSKVLCTPTILLNLLFIGAPEREILYRISLISTYRNQEIPQKTSYHTNFAPSPPSPQPVKSHVVLWYLLRGTGPPCVGSPPIGKRRRLQRSNAMTNHYPDCVRHRSRRRRDCAP